MSSSKVRLVEPDTAESTLTEIWKEGNDAAGAELLRRHQPSVRRFFQNKVSSELDDLVQETLAAAVAGRDRFEARSTFKAYLLSIARHRLYEYYRKKKRDQRVFEFDTVSVFDLSPSPSLQAAQHDEQRLLLEALRCIPINSQIVLELHYWEELSGPEIAEVVGLPLDTAYSRLRKAKQQLRKKIEALEQSQQALQSTADRLDLWATSIRTQVLPDDVPSDSK